jgi:DNA excision repair protein ERCC-2
MVLRRQVCATVPDGVVCFFTAYESMERTVIEWDESGVFRQILEHKLVFIEVCSPPRLLLTPHVQTKDIVETSLALDNYRRACDCGRGAVFLSVARGKVSEGIDFEMQYGRAVILFGVPFQYTKSQVLLERLEYLKRTFGIPEADFLTFDALRSAAQCLGRVLRSKQDWGIMILADLRLVGGGGCRAVLTLCPNRYNNPAKREKLPSWIKHELSDAHLNLSTDGALAGGRGGRALSR